MYKSIIPKISYGEKIGIELEFSISAFEDLVSFSIMGVTREINSFNRGKIKNRYQFVRNIGSAMEIIKHAIFLSAMDKEIVFKEETKNAIKKLVFNVNKLICKLGEHDSDFCSDSNTERARVPEEPIKYISKMKW